MPCRTEPRTAPPDDRPAALHQTAAWPAVGPCRPGPARPGWPPVHTKNHHSGNNLLSGVYWPTGFQYQTDVAGTMGAYWHKSRVPAHSNASFASNAETSGPCLWGHSLQLSAFENQCDRPPARPDAKSPTACRWLPPVQMRPPP